MVAEAVPQRGDLCGVVAAECVPQPPRGASLGIAAFRLEEEAVDAGAEEARRAEAEVVREPGDGVGEHAVDEEQRDEDPLQGRVRQRRRDPARPPVERCRQLPRRRRHGCSRARASSLFLARSTALTAAAPAWTGATTLLDRSLAAERDRRKVCCGMLAASGDLQRQSGGMRWQGAKEEGCRCRVGRMMDELF